MWWYTTVIPTLRKEKHRDQEFKVSLSYLTSLRPTWTTWDSLCFEREKKKGEMRRGEGIWGEGKGNKGSRGEERRGRRINIGIIFYQFNPFRKPYTQYWQIWNQQIASKSMEGGDGDSQELRALAEGSGWVLSTHGSSQWSIVPVPGSLVSLLASKGTRHACSTLIYMQANTDTQNN